MITNLRATTRSNRSRPFGPHTLHGESCNAVPTRIPECPMKGDELNGDARFSFGAADPDQMVD